MKNLSISGAFIAAAALVSAPAVAWEPTKSIEIVVAAGAGGASDQMARMMQAAIQKNNLMKQPVIVTLKGGASGAEALMYMKSSDGDPNKVLLAYSLIYMLPLSAKIPFNWRDLTPVAVTALDEFVLWDNTTMPEANVKDFINAAKAASPPFKMGGTGSKQEDQILTAGIEKSTGTKFIYVPFKGGGEVAVQLVGGHVDSTVNNPIEAVAQWRAGALRPLCVFDSKKLDYKEKITADMSWNDIPTCKSQGLDVEYVMLRGYFMPPGVTKDQVAYYVDLFKKVRETPEWKKLMDDGAFNQTFMTGDDYAKWVANAEKLHEGLMKEAGFLAKTN